MLDFNKIRKNELIRCCLFRLFPVEPPIQFYDALSLSPKASACFFAFNRRSAMLEFLLCATANAAKFNGYCGIENRPLPPFIAAAY